MKVFTTQRGHNGAVARIARQAGLPAAMLLACAAAAQAEPAPDAAHVAWRDTITHTPTPQEGCFAANFPDKAWHKVECKTAPTKPYLPAHGHRGYTVGNGNDYSAVVGGIISSALGSFPTVTGLKRETGYGGQANTYSLQLNSQFFNTSVCNGGSNAANCLGWEQFVYSNSSGAFMQYWLINYGNTCPTGGWMAYQGSCYRNSAEVSVPAQAATQLGNMKISATAVANGTDTLVLSTANSAYTTTGKDSVVLLANSWNAGEYNVVGDGGGSAAKFNKGTSITVQIALKDGSTAAPTCQGNDGTTGETNNLTLGACSVAGGTTPSVSFVEKR